MASPRHRLQGLFWELSPPIRRWLRGLRRWLSLTLHRVRHRLTPDAGTRVSSVRGAEPAPRFSDPGAALLGSGQTLDAFQQAQKNPFENLPAVHGEALLMAAAAEDLSWVAAGWASPAPGRFGPTGLIAGDPDTFEAAHLLLRRPAANRAGRAAVVGRTVPHITSEDRCRGLNPLATHAPSAGPYRLRPDAARAAVVASPWFPVDVVLEGLPTIGGPPTALFLLPFLAVGGAERLLFELMEELGDRYRLLVATTDPHLASLGQTVDRARELTSNVYTLGDWLPHDAVPSAIRHLIRRWEVESLVCWNGSVLFYDEAVAFRRAFPELRIVNQLFNHRGGWIEHFSPTFIRAVDTQIAVNTPIARALVDDRGVAEDRVATIHHAVGAAEPRDEKRRARLRREFGVADNTVVVGTFIRMHPQKRPLDIVRLARCMVDDDVHFLLVGGGPLDDAVDTEIARDPPPNLTRLPLEPDATPLYDAIDLCLMTSDFEGLPVFLLDGLARGLPCVATAVGDIPLMLRDGGGTTVDRPGELEALAQAVRSFVDDDHRRVEGERGRTAVNTRFGLERYVSAYESVIFPTP